MLRSPKSLRIQFRRGKFTHPIGFTDPIFTFQAAQQKHQKNIIKKQGSTSGLWFSSCQNRFYSSQARNDGKRNVLGAANRGNDRKRIVLGAARRGNYGKRNVLGAAGAGMMKTSCFGSWLKACCGIVGRPRSRDASRWPRSAV
jgi:hypothetical protein